MQEVTMLDLGCGNKKRDGAIGVDFNSRTNPDIVHDLNKFPYPFGDSSVDTVIIDNTLEHLDDPLLVMEEIYRIIRGKGLVKVIVPYFRSASAFIDPTHKHFFTVNSFAYYDPSNEICNRYDYTTARFKVVKIVFNETLKLRSPLKYIVKKLANMFPLRYERHLSHLIPMDDITFYLEPI